MKGKFTLQYASNFFLDLHKRRDFNKMCVPSSENLALLGNICRISNMNEIKIYKEFLDYCSKTYKNVYLVPGVYEFCSNENMPLVYEKCIMNLYKLKKQYKNVTLLDNSYASIPNTNINLIGSTLWSRNPYLKHHCMFEYNSIWLNRHSGIGNIMGDDIVNWHLEDLQYIRDLTNANNNYIVLTHHLPHPILTRDITRKRMDTSNLEKYMKKPIEVWLGGAGDNTVSGSFGISRDVFCATNPYTTFRLAKHEMNESYDPSGYVSLRTDTPQLV